jgi:hypothetical protein
MAAARWTRVSMKEETVLMPLTDFPRRRPSATPLSDRGGIFLGDPWDRSAS